MKISPFIAIASLCGILAGWSALHIRQTAQVKARERAASLAQQSKLVNEANGKRITKLLEVLESNERMWRQVRFGFWASLGNMLSLTYVKTNDVQVLRYLSWIDSERKLYQFYEFNIRPLSNVVTSFERAKG